MGKLDKELSSRLTRLKGLLQKEDIEGLVAGGAPLDEYDPEARMIESKIAQLQLIKGAGPPSEEVLISLIREVWREMFSRDDYELNARSAAFARIAAALRSG